MKTQINISPYINSHAKQPRGRGYWAFCPTSQHRDADYIDHSFFVSGSYAEAKARAVKHFTKLGIASAVTLP
jgi:hypothetical protein